jgi:hypothetical protein
VRNGNGDLLADSHYILHWWKKYLSQFLNVHTGEPLVPGPSRVDVEIAIAKLKKYKSAGSYQLPAKLIQAGGEILLPEIHILIHSVWNKERIA